MKVIFVFIDGLGLGSDNSAQNPVVSARTPFLDRILGCKLTASARSIANSQALLLPVDACLGMEGLPQSATGQTALFTGINASQMLGTHLSGFPNRTLAELLCNHNLLIQLCKLGLAVTSANMYTPLYQEILQNQLKIEGIAGFCQNANDLGRFLSKEQAKKIERWRRHSASTITIVSAGLRPRTIEDLLAGQAVYQDITNSLLRQWDVHVPVLSPSQAGVNLGRIANQFDFTLFEFFQSDIAGHAKDFARSVEIIETLDQFLASTFTTLAGKDTLMIVTSDHGNIEDLSVKTHTRNAVPALFIGKHEYLPQNHIQSITDIFPAVLQLFLRERVATHD